MAAFNKFNSFTQALAEKQHNLSTDTLEVALCASANAPIATNSQLSNLTQISYTNLSSRVIGSATGSSSSGTYKLVLPDLVLTASGTVAAFRYIILFNQTSINDLLIGWYDYTSDLTLLNGETLTIDFDAANGVLTLV
jgi:hypothetical protein